MGQLSLYSRNRIGATILIAVGFWTTTSIARSQPIITTVAGSGVAAYSGDGGMAASAALDQPQGVKVDASGNIYIVDTANCRVRRVSAAGVISTFAGNGVCGSAGDGGLATNANVGDITDVAIDSTGNVYIADATSHRVRKVTPDGIIAAFAGTGAAAYSGDGGPAISANINRPIGLTIDGAGNLYVSDSATQNVRRVSLASGIIMTVAGNGTTGFSGDGGPATSAALQYPLGLAADSDGNLYIADAGNGVVRRVTPAGVISTVAGSGLRSGFGGDGGPATSGLLNIPSGVGIDSTGSLLIGDAGNNRLRRVDRATGIITTISGGSSNGFGGDGGPASAALLNFPWGIATDSAGAIYIADRDNNRIRRVSASSTAQVNIAAGRVATQSSTLPGAPSAGAFAAVDGRTDGNFYDASVTATDLENNPWWQVDLLGTAAINSVTIWNRTDCCVSRLSDYWVFVSDMPFQASDTPATLPFRPGTFSSHQTSAPSPSTTIIVGGQGRYVRVQLSHADYLSLAEVQVSSSGAASAGPTDLARGKSATESSTFPGSPAASAAVDGNPDGGYYDNSVTATDSQPNAWWQVDLGTSAAIDSVVLWNRTDCCGSRLADYWIFVSDTPFSTTDTPATLAFRMGTFSRHQTGAPAPSATFAVGAQGRYVRVQLSGTDYLSLAEVQVFGQ